jgi:hypothetical protein
MARVPSSQHKNIIAPGHGKAEIFHQLDDTGV